MSGEVRFVRLRPVDPRSGHSVASFAIRYGGKFHKFKEPGVWYKVPLGLAELLAKARQIPTRPQSPPIFDVCKRNEALALDAAAKAKREAARAVEEPSVATAREVAIDEPGRGDLTLDEVTAGRKAALEDYTARSAAGWDIDEKNIDEAPTEPDSENAELSGSPKPVAPRGRGGRGRRKK